MRILLTRQREDQWLAKSRLVMRDQLAEDMELPTKLDASVLLNRRIRAISKWLRESAVNCTREQLHLEEGTSERQYWHYGYLSALHDVQRLFALEKESSN